MAGLAACPPQAVISPPGFGQEDARKLEPAQLPLERESSYEVRPVRTPSGFHIDVFEMPQKVFDPEADELPPLNALPMVHQHSGVDEHYGLDRLFCVDGGNMAACCESEQCDHSDSEGDEVETPPKKPTPVDDDEEDVERELPLIANGEKEVDEVTPMRENGEKEDVEREAPLRANGEDEDVEGEAPLRANGEEQVENVTPLRANGEDEDVEGEPPLIANGEEDGEVEEVTPLRANGEEEDVGKETPMKHVQKEEVKLLLAPEMNDVVEQSEENADPADERTPPRPVKVDVDCGGGARFDVDKAPIPVVPALAPATPDVDVESKADVAPDAEPLDVEAPDAASLDVATPDAEAHNADAEAGADATPDFVRPDAASLDIETPDAEQEPQVTPDAGAPNVAAADAGAPNVAVADVEVKADVTPDFVTPDAALLDVATPDADLKPRVAPDAGALNVAMAVAEVKVDATPVFVTPELVTPDAEAPDVATPDLAIPHLATPDLAALGAATPEAESKNDCNHKSGSNASSAKEAVAEESKEATPSPDTSGDPSTSSPRPFRVYDPSKKYRISRTKCKEKVIELSDSISESLDDWECKKLLDVYEKTTITKETLSLWENYFGTTYDTKASIKSPIVTCIDYVESGKPVRGTKNKLRYITQQLSDPECAFDAAGILVLLAYHGGMCHVQKEVGITMAYALMAGSLKGEMQRQSISHAISQLLHKLKIKTVETMFKGYGRYMNTHPLLAFQNGLSEHVGLDFVPDEHQDPEVATPEQIKRFFELYNLETCVEVVGSAINEKPRKIPYDATVKWLEEHVPPGLEKYDFLMEVFDTDGKVKSSHITDMLLSEGILEEDDGTSEDPPSEEVKSETDAEAPKPKEADKAKRPALLKNMIVVDQEKQEDVKKDAKKGRKKFKNPFRRKKKKKDDLANRPPWANANYFIRPQADAVPIGKPANAQAGIRARMRIFEDNDNKLKRDGGGGDGDDKRKPPPPLKNLW